MGPFAAVASIALLFVFLVTLVAKVDGLTLLGPRSAGALRASAEYFCTERCRQDGRCPLTGADEPAEACPLRKFVDTDLPTAVRGRPPDKPFEALHV